MASDFQSLKEGLANAGIKDNQLILPTTLGPIKVQDLAALDGWIYSLYQIGYPGTEPVLINGGASVPLANYTDERGWVLVFAAVFRSPWATLTFQADNFGFTVNPLTLNLTPHIPVPMSVYCNLYNPATIFGPLYGIEFSPTYAIPYARNLQINLSLPAGSPVATTTVWNGSVGKIYIVDYPTFLKSLKKHSVEQITGQKVERYP